MLEVKLPNTQNLKIWEKIDIVVGEGNQIGVYSSRIEDFINNGIIITPPVFLRGKTLLREGLDVRVVVTRDDATYEFASRIKKISLSSKRLLILTPPKYVHRIQRRRFCRIDVVSDVAFLKASQISNGAGSFDDLIWSQGRTVNISGGGLLMHTPTVIDQGERLIMKIDFFGENDLPEFVAGICRRTFTDNERHFAGLEFILKADITPNFERSMLAKLPPAICDFDQVAQDRLVNYVFLKQVDLHRKGLL